MSKQSTKFWHKSIADQWKLYQPPVRPSKSEIKIFEGFMKRKGLDKKVLVLGATPELRDLAHKLKAKVTICDISLTMMMTMVDLMKYKKKAKDEIWIRSDWLEAPLKYNHYDYVIGDFVVSNIPFKLQNDFFKKIKSLLKPGGYFITRMEIVDHTKKSKVEEIIEEYVDKKSVNINEFCFAIQLAIFDKRNYQISIERAKKVMRKYLRKLKGEKYRKAKKLFSLFNFYYPGKKVWWCPPKKILDKMIKRYFKILKIKLGNDHKFVEYCPVYLLKKK